VIPALLIREPSHDTLQQVFELGEETTIGGLAHGVNVGSESPLATVSWRDGAWWIRPSVDGVLVDDVPLEGELALRHGQLISRPPRWCLRFLLGDRARALDELRHINTVTDGLTMLLNRRALFQLLERTTAGVVMLIDIDWTKSINDRFGMMAGDRTIRRTAAILHAHVAWPDLVARYGGEEFVVVMPHATPDEARVLAEQLRLAAEPPFLFEGEPITATISIGFQAWLPGGGRATLEVADENLAAAKSTGRNRVVG
jgi:diguanylate cyclase (GGDEF)-like protein